MLDRLETSPLLDEASGRKLFATLRRDLESAGATDADVVWLTENHLVRWVVESSGLSSTQMKQKQFGVIAAVFVRRNVTARVDKGRVVSVRVG